MKVTRTKQKKTKFCTVVYRCECSAKNEKQNLSFVTKHWRHYYVILPALSSALITIKFWFLAGYVIYMESSFEKTSLKVRKLMHQKRLYKIGLIGPSWPLAVCMITILDWNWPIGCIRWIDSRWIAPIHCSLPQKDLLQMTIGWKLVNGCISGDHHHYFKVPLPLDNISKFHILSFDLAPHVK